MALLNFPDPTVIQIYTANGNSWEWNGTSWVSANNLDLANQVSGVLGTVYGGTGKALSGMSVGSVIYADTSSSFAALAPGTNNYVLATQGSGSAPYWKVDDSGTGSVGAGNNGGFAYYTGTNSITSGTGVSYISASNKIVLTSQILSLPSSVIDSGVWAGTAISLANGGTNGNRSGIAVSYQLAVYNSAGAAITQINTTSSIGNSILLQTAQTAFPTWVGQSSLVVGGATTAGSAVTATNAGIAYTSNFSGSAFTATNAGSSFTALNAGIAYTSNFSGSAFTATNAGSSFTALNAGIAYTSNFSGSAFTATNAGLAVTATNAGIAYTSNFSGSAFTATNAGVAYTSNFSGSAFTATNAGLAVTATNAGIAWTSNFSGSAFTATNAGSAFTAINAGLAVTATNAGIAWTSNFSGSAFTATNAGSAFTAVNAGLAVTATNAGIAYTSNFSGSAFTATNAGSSFTALNAGIAYTSNFSGSAFTSTNAGRAEGVRTQTFSGIDYLALLDNDNANATSSLYSGSGISVQSGLFVISNKDTILGNGTNSTTTATGALRVVGGLGVTGNLNVGGNFILTGDFTVNGTTTTVNSTVSTVVDPIVTIGTGIGGTVPNTADSKDRGIAFYYFSGTGRTGFFGWDQSASKFALFTSATISGEEVSGTRGILAAELDGIAGGATTAGSAVTATNAGIAYTSNFSGSAFTATNAGIAYTSNFSGSAFTATNAGLAVTATNAGIAYTSNFSGSAFTATNAGSAFTAINAGLAVTATNAGIAYTSNFSGSAFTATNAGSAFTSINAGLAVTATNAGIAWTSNFSGSAFTATNAGSAFTALNAGIAWTSNFSGSAFTATNSGSAFTALNAGIAYTSNFSGSAFTATNAGLAYTSNFSGSAVTAANAGLAGLATSSVLVGIGTTIATAYLAAVLLNTATGGTQIYTGSGITIGNNRITATTFQGNHLGTWSGSAVTALYGGTGLDTVSKLNVLAGASTGNSWVAIGSSYLPTAYVGEFAPPFLTAFGATQAGQLWWDSTYGVLKVYYADLNTNQWVDALPVLGSNGGSAVKRSYLLSFGAGFTPSLGADSVSILIPYAPDNTSLYYYIKRLDYRNETVSSGAGVSFYIERNTTQNPSTAWTIANTIHSAAGSSFKTAGIYITSYTLSGSGASFVSSAGVAASVMSGDYLRLNFTALNGAATLAVSMIIEQQ